MKKLKRLSLIVSFLLFLIGPAVLAGSWSSESASAAGAELDRNNSNPGNYFRTNEQYVSTANDDIGGTAVYTLLEYDGQNGVFTLYDSRDLVFEEWIQIGWFDGNYTPDRGLNLSVNIDVALDAWFAVGYYDSNLNFHYDDYVDVSFGYDVAYYPDVYSSDQELFICMYLLSPMGGYYDAQFQIQLNYGEYSNDYVMNIHEMIEYRAENGLGGYTQEEYLEYGQNQFDAGSAVGRDTGFAEGYQKAQSELTDTELANAVREFAFALFDAPVATFTNATNLQYDSFDFSTLASLVLTGIIIVGVVKVFA